MSPALTSTPQRHPSVLVQQVQPGDPSLVLLNPHSGEYYTLDDVGARVWQLCDGKRTVAQIAEVVAQEYEAPPEVIERDVMALLKELIDEALVVAAG